MSRKSKDQKTVRAVVYLKPNQLAALQATAKDHGHGSVSAALRMVLDSHFSGKSDETAKR